MNGELEPWPARLTHSKALPERLPLVAALRRLRTWNRRPEVETRRRRRAFTPNSPRRSLNSVRQSNKLSRTTSRVEEGDYGDQRTSPRILIVEDDPLQAMKVEALLQSDGYDVCVASNGREALCKMGNSRPDIVVSDIVMPEMDGYEMCTRIRSNHEFNGVGVILLTCLSEPQDVIRGLTAGSG